MDQLPLGVVGELGATRVAIPTRGTRCDRGDADGRASGGPFLHISCQMQRVALQGLAIRQQLFVFAVAPKGLSYYLHLNFEISIMLWPPIHDMNVASLYPLAIFRLKRKVEGITLCIIPR